MKTREEIINEINRLERKIGVDRDIRDTVAIWEAQHKIEMLKWVLSESEETGYPKIISLRTLTEKVRDMGYRDFTVGDKMEIEDAARATLLILKDYIIQNPECNIGELINKELE